MCITKTNHFLQRTSLPPCFLLSLPRATFLLRLFLARRAECSSVRVASIRRIAQLHVQRVRDHSSGHRSVRLRSRPRRSQIKLRNVPPQRFARLLPPRAPRVARSAPRRSSRRRARRDGCAPSRWSTRVAARCASSSTSRLPCTRWCAT